MYTYRIPHTHTKQSNQNLKKIRIHSNLTYSKINNKRHLPVNLIPKKSLKPPRKIWITNNSNIEAQNQKLKSKNITICTQNPKITTHTLIFQHAASNFYNFYCTNFIMIISLSQTSGPNPRHTAPWSLENITISRTLSWSSYRHEL